MSYPYIPSIDRVPSREMMVTSMRKTERKRIPHVNYYLLIEDLLSLRHLLQEAVASFRTTTSNQDDTFEV